MVYAEDMPAPNIKGERSNLIAACHRLTMLRVAWDPFQRCIIMTCAECGAPVMAAKVERRSKIEVVGQIPPRTEEGNA